MTNKQLEKYGIYHINRNRYHVKGLDITIILPKSPSLEDIFIQIKEIGYGIGYTDGRKAQSQAILDIINKPLEES